MDNWSYNACALFLDMLCNCTVVLVVLWVVQDLLKGLVVSPDQVLLRIRHDDLLPHPAPGGVDRRVAEVGLVGGLALDDEREA